MAIVTTRPGANGRARPSLGEQLDRLDGILNGLSDALNESVTTAVSATVGRAVREAVESATREMAARYIPQTAEHAQPELPQRRPNRRLTGQLQALTRRVFMQAGRLLPRLGSPLVASARHVSRAPGRFAAWALAGFLAGATAGVGGPLVGATMGAAAGFAFALHATRPS